jgi:4'-phosphopantetheinyl transferase
MEPLPLPSPPLLRLAEIHIWLQRLAVGTATSSRLQLYLDDTEQQQASRYHFDRDRNRFVVARGTLRTILAEYLRTPPAEIHIVMGSKASHSLPRIAPTTD